MSVINPLFYNPEEFPGETPKGEDMLELDGYADTKTLVSELLLAGEKLSAYRADEYDYNGDENEDLDDYNDPTRAPGFDDLVDGQQLFQRASLSVLNFQDRARRIQKVKESAAVEKQPLDSYEKRVESLAKSTEGENSKN